MKGMSSRTRTRHRRNLDNARARSRAAGLPPEDIDVMASLRASAERGSDRARHLVDVFEGIVSELQAADPEAVEHFDDDLDDGSCKSCLIADSTDGRLCDECSDTLCRRCEAFLDSGDLPGGLCTLCRPNDLEGGTCA